MLFLIDYDRQKGEIVSLREFGEAESDAARAASLAREIELGAQGATHEIVLLQGPSLDDIKRTHRRYFESLDELLSGLRDELISRAARASLPERT